MARLGTATTLTVLALAGAQLPVAAFGLSAHGSSAHGSDADQSDAHVWLTTPDGADRMADLGTVAFGAAVDTAVPTVVVDPNRQFQEMTGFGASITDSSAAVIYRLAPGARAKLMTDLFATDDINFLRQPIGASDFTDEPAYTYDDVPAGHSDYALEHFSIAHDRAQILPLLREAARLSPHLKIMATPWSPPAWMKTNGSLAGGRLIDSPAVYRAYAGYLAKFVRAYRAEGVRIDYLSIQNEPQNRNPAGYPGMDLPSWQAAKVIELLGPMLRTRRPRSSGTTTTGASTRTTRPAPRRTRPPTSTTTHRSCSRRPPPAGCPAPPTTAIPASRAR